MSKISFSSSIESVVGNGGRSTMAARIEPADSLDFFPTPPFGTRALVERVLPHVGVNLTRANTIWESACGEGHMSEVLAEYATVIASDIHGYRPNRLYAIFSTARLRYPGSIG
jgi:hypothetical protein